MLAAEFGGIRPWELERFTPDEERSIHRRAEALDRQEVS
jgi:hypothetical protein